MIYFQFPSVPNQSIILFSIVMLINIHENDFFKMGKLYAFKCMGLVIDLHMFLSGSWIWRVHWGSLCSIWTTQVGDNGDYVNDQCAWYILQLNSIIVFVLYNIHPSIVYWVISFIRIHEFFGSMACVVWPSQSGLPYNLLRDPLKWYSVGKSTGKALMGW